MASGGKREGAGRKPSPYKCRQEIRISPENKKWLADNGGATHAVNMLVDAARKAERD